MKHFLFSGSESPDEIKRILLDNCEGVEDKSYMKQLSDDELADLKTDYVENNFQLKSFNDDLKIEKEKHRTLSKPLIQENRELLSILKTRHREISGKVYRVANHDSGFMEYVNEAGEIIETRKLKPEEKQTRIRPMSRASNDQ